MTTTTMSEIGRIRTVYRTLAKSGAISLDRQKMLNILIKRQKEIGNTLEDAIARLENMGRDETDSTGRVIVQGANPTIVSDSIAWVKAHW